VVNSDYKSQYVGAAETAITQQGRRGWHVTPARRQHNIQRTNQHRLEKGKDTLSQIREGLDAKLEVGLEEVEDALNQIEANKTMTAVTFLLTTRTLGFCAAQIYFQAPAQRIPIFCNIYSFYRVNLALLEAKLYKIRQIQEAPIQKVDETYEIPSRPDFSLITQTVNAYPDQVGRAIKAIVPILEGEEYFVSALACTGGINSFRSLAGLFSQI
jgi:hypothetical protein